MFSLILVSHIGGALVVGGVGVYAIRTVYVGQAEKYSALAKTMAWSGAFEIITGALLSFVSPEPGSVAHFCGKIVIYTAFIVAIETALWLEMKKSVFVFPTQTARLLSVASGAAVLSALIFVF
jgi:hypothetical protein